MLLKNTAIMRVLAFHKRLREENMRKVKNKYLSGSTSHILNEDKTLQKRFVMDMV